MGLGTGACPGTTFYCKNVGHIGMTIPSSRVQDGLCGKSPHDSKLPRPNLIPEPECCDGSDEAPGVCSNTCEEVGQEYRKKEEAERKLRKTVRATGVPPWLTSCSLFSRAPKYVLRTLRLHRRSRNGSRNS